MFEQPGVESAEPAGAEACPDATSRLERDLAATLSLALGLGRVSVESHFFETLGADSLLMARFCARVRKRPDLPPVSITDVYAHPTIRRLAAALATAAPRPAAPFAASEAEEATRTSTAEYLLTGALQCLCFLGYAYAALVATFEGYAWVSGGAGAAGIGLRLVALTAASFVAASLVPIGAKWVLIGRFKPGRIRIWSPAYVRFWIVKSLIRSSPGARLFVGTPVYGLYLRALGARIGPGAVIFSRRVPVCADLLTIGAGAVIRKEAIFSCYRAQAGRIEIGPVSVGRDAFVGERSVLDIDTRIGDGAQLGHASALLSGQSVPDGERWHGSPAQRTEVSYLRVPQAPGGRNRRVAFSVVAALAVLVVYLPLVSGGLALLFHAGSALTGAIDPSFAVDTDAMTWRGLLENALVLSSVLFACVTLAGLLLVVAVPRLLGPFLEVGRVYPLYGVHDAIHRTIARIGRMKFYTYLFGDSSYIVPYLRWLGYDLTRVEQTGSNFGIEVIQANPSLCTVGSGTMVADGLAMMNDEVSSSSFRVSKASLGPRSFVGNDVIYPAGGRTGANCLLATKVMVPIDGDFRENVGLLGSPSFEIPRSVDRDTRFDHRRTGDALRRGLAAKDRYNRRTIGLFLFTRWLGIFLVVAIYLAAIESYGMLAHFVAALLVAAGAVISAVYLALVERCIAARHPLGPRYCSIYDPDFWVHERLWKVHPINYLHAFDGTPFKNVLWRLLGVRIGRRVFDDGAHISEPTLTAIGDDCVLNLRSKIQCHSQEDGTFKADRSTIGAGCTIGVAAFVHYGVTIGDGAVLAADSFLMKGEEVPPGARWGGNPAREA